MKQRWKYILSFKISVDKFLTYIYFFKKEKKTKQK